MKDHAQATIELINAAIAVAENVPIKTAFPLEQQDQKLSVVVAHCEHPVVAHDIDDGATCSKCGRDLGWFCHISPKHYCEYTDCDELCIHCGAPEERQ